MSPPPGKAWSAMPSQQPRAITSSSSDQQHILKKLMSWTTLWLPTKWLSPRCWELTLECVTEESSRKMNQDGKKMLTSRSPSSRRLWAPEMWPASRRNFSTAPTLWSRARMMSSGNLWRTATTWATTGLGPSLQKGELLIMNSFGGEAEDPVSTDQIRTEAFLLVHLLVWVSLRRVPLTDVKIHLL